jgi:hypothetical protein
MPSTTLCLSTSNLRPRPGHITAYRMVGPERFPCHSVSFGFLSLILHADTCHAGIDREPTLSWGPEYSSRFKIPQFLPGSSTNSASSRTTGRPEQVRFPARFHQTPTDSNLNLSHHSSSALSAETLSACLRRTMSKNVLLLMSYLKSRPDVCRSSTPRRTSNFEHFALRGQR